MAKNTTIVEINGVKVEVDLRTARRVSEFKVGDRVKLLSKEYSSTEIYHGVIVGFEAFEQLPTIVVAYVNSSYNPELRIAYLNSKTMAGADGKFEIIPDLDETLPFRKADVLRNFDRQIEQKVSEINDILLKKSYFVARFGKMFGETTAEILTNQKAVDQQRIDVLGEIKQKVADYE